MGRWIAAGLIVLLCSIDCRADAPPSMAGWSRVPDLQYQFERDYKACSQQLKPVPSLKLKPVDFTECMRGLGWEKK